MINIEVYSTHAVIRSQQPLTVGLRGASAHFTFGEPWVELTKTAVFRQGEKTVTVVDIGRQVEIPWEVLTLPGVPVMIGIYGTDAQEKLVIPTVWAETEPVRPGTDPDQGVSPAEPTPSVWEQLQGHMGSLEQLQTNDKTSLAAAINEANRAVLAVAVSGADGSYETQITMAELSAAVDAGKSPLCYWEEHRVWLPLAKLDIREKGMSFADFSLTAKNKEYYIHMASVSGGDMEVTGSVTVLATENSKLPNPEKLTLVGNTTAEYDGSEAVTVDIPTKVSQLQNDRDFLTKETAPVTSVNGQTGAVTVDIPTKVSQLQNDSGFLTEVPVTTTKVSLTEQPDGSYLSDLSAADIMAAYKDHKTVHCYHDKLILPLIHSVITGAVFSGIYDGQIQTVTVNSNKVATVTATPVSSGGGGADGLLFDQATGMLYLLQSGQILGNGVQLPAAEGGSTNNAVLTLENTTGWSNKTIPQEQGNCMLSINWSSVEDGVSTGSGTLIVKVENELRYSANIKQGEYSLNVMDYLILGENRVVVTVTDFRGNSKSILFNVSVYDPAALISTKLVERTLTGDYTNDRVTTVGANAFVGLTLGRLVLPNVTGNIEASFAGLVADEVELDSVESTSYWMVINSTIGVLRLPNVTSISTREDFRATKVERIVFNRLEDFVCKDDIPAFYLPVVTLDFHNLKSFNNSIQSGTLTNLIIRRPDAVCTLRNAPESTTVKLYVPAALVEQYKVATNWSSMADRIFAIEDNLDFCGGE